MAPGGQLLSPGSQFPVGIKRAIIIEVITVAIHGSDEVRIMKQKGLWISSFLIVFLASAVGVQAAKNYRVLTGPDHFYFGHISYTEAKADGAGPFVLREGQSMPEVAILNLPLGPGDTIRTPADRRCEIQFDTGTIIRLDFDTELRIETILAQSLSTSTQLSNLVLGGGRIYVMYKEYDSREMFQVLTADAAFKMGHDTVAIIRAAADGSTDAQVKYGKASALFGPDERSVKKQDIKKMERLIILKDHQFERAAYLAGSDFELWNNQINARFDELHKGQNALPKPIQKLTPAVFYFAQQYGYKYGEWLWDDIYGYVWRPFLDRMEYPWGWAPYHYGEWSYSGGQLYWVPEESWGWIPYHLGIWQWDKKLGWVWLPGSLFAPAWVDWEFFFGYCGWRPWSLFDWFDGFSTDFGFMNGAWYYGFLQYAVAGPIPGGPPGLTPMQGNRLKQTFSPFVMPGEFKSIYKNVLAAYKKGDPRVIEPVKQLSAQTVFVSKGDLNSPKIQDKALAWDTVPKLNAAPPAKGGISVLRKPANAQQAAALAYCGNEAAQMLLHKAAVPGRAQMTSEGAVGTLRPPSVPDAGAGSDRGHVSGTMKAGHQMRFLDWNPDIKVARELGVRIEYSSRSNEIRCPELRLSSMDRERGQGGYISRLTSSGVTHEPAGSRSSSGRSSGSGAFPSGHGSGAGAQGSTKEASSGSEGGGKIKN
jgi:hypothetical protein